MKYTPLITSATTRQVYQFEPYMAVLLTDIESPGAVRYEYLLVVMDQRTEEAVLCVSSEVNQLAELNNAGSHFLCLFPGNSHENLGASDKWANVDDFAQQALAIVRQRLSSER